MGSVIDKKPVSIDLLPGEWWWGGSCQDGALMPLGPGYARDLRSDHGGNQASPLLLSNLGRYVWRDDAFGVAMEDGRLALEDGDGVCLGEGFGDLAGAFRAACRHFPPSGKMPPEVAFSAPQFNTWMEMGPEPTQAKVLEYARTILDHGFVPGLFIIDDGWSAGYGQWQFHPERFPSPREMMMELTEMGFTMMLWIVPFVTPGTEIALELGRQGLLLRNSQGEVAIREWWNGHSAVLDLTNPAAIAWVHDEMDALSAEYGIRGFKMDAGDPDVFRGSDRAYSPTDPSGFCAAWGKVGLRYSLCEYRACWKLGGTAAIHRLRDKHHRWGRDGLADLIPNAIVQGLIGHAFVCPDMVGGGDIGSSFPQGVDQELFVRTAQCSALFPMIQFSLAPWRVLDDFHLQVCREVLEIRSKLMPEILAIAGASAQNGEPMMRHLAYSFPRCGYERVQDQFLLGEDLLVAPVLSQGASGRKVTFPPGRWTSREEGQVMGPCEVWIDAPLTRLPWFQRCR